MALFTVTTQNDAKIKDSNFADYYSSIHRNIEWSVMEPLINQAGRRFVKPFFPKLYDAISTLEAEPTEGIQLDLLKLVREAVAWYTIYLGMGTNNFQFSAQGVVESGSSDGNVSPVQAWRFKSSRHDIMIHADFVMDEILDLAILNKTDPFLTDKLDDIGKGTVDFFKGTANFQLFYYISDKRRTFLAMIPFISESLLIHVRPILGDVTYKLLLDYYNSPPAEPLAVNEKAINLLQQIASSRAISKAATKLSLEITDESIRMVSSLNDSKVKIEDKSRAVAMLKEAADDTARTARADLWQFLFQNADSFPDWKEINVPEESTTPEEPKGHPGSFVL